MSEWKEYKLSEVMEIIGGGTPKTSVDEYWDGNIPWLSVVDFNTGKKFVYETEKSITKNGLENSSTKILQKGDIIISARGTVGVLSVLGKEMAFNQSCYGIRNIPNRSNNDFIYYLLKDTVDNFIQVAHGGVFDTITRSTFDNIKVQVPFLPKQKATATVLSSLDDKIDLLHRQNETLEAMAETLFRQWFVERRPELVEGEAEEDWEEGVIPDEFDFTMGLSPPGKTYNEEDVGTPMFQGSTDFGFRFPSNRVYTTESKRLAQKYDTLVSVRAPVGDQNMAKEKCCIGRGVAAFRYKKNNSFYTYTYFKIKSLMHKIKVFNQSGTVFGSITKSNFQKMEIVIPPFSLIQYFQEVVQPLNDRIIKNCFQIQTLEKLRDTLLPKLMSGEVRVALEESEKKAVTIQSSGKKKRNIQFEEAILISAIIKAFYAPKIGNVSRQWYQKISYLHKRKLEDNRATLFELTEEYGKKAAGPYKKEMRYQGPEGIAISNGYIKPVNKQAFKPTDKIEDIDKYFYERDYWNWKVFENWTVPTLKFVRVKKLGVWATVDYCLIELKENGRDLTPNNVIGYLNKSKEWKHKIKQPEFSPKNIESAIEELFDMYKY